MTYRREDSAGYLVNWAGRLFTRAVERRLVSGGAGPMPVYFALRNGCTMTQRDLAVGASVEQPTMANTLNRMERDGLILRQPDPDDGRSMLIALTPLGHERARQALDAAMTVNALALGGLSEAEREHFFALLRRVIAALDADSTETPPPLPE